MGPMPTLKAFVAKAFASLRRGFKAPFRKAHPPADGLLSDAVRLAELASPVEREEPRIQFVLERLKRSGIVCRIDADGNAIVPFPVPGSGDPRPVLVHACLGTKRWHPLGSLSRLDAVSARGAGLADALPAAVLLALAEAAAGGAFGASRSIVFAFLSRSPESADGDAYGRLLDALGARPVVAIGLRGTGLSRVAGKPLGAARFIVSISAPAEAKTARANPSVPVPSAVSLAAELVGRLEGVRWDASGATSCRVARVAAGSGFGRPPVDATVEIELESADQGVLDLAVGAVGATAAKTGEGTGVAVKVAEASRLPVPDARLSAPLASIVKAVLKELKIKAVEASYADPAAFLSSRGIPAVSIGVSEAVEGYERDELELATLGAGFRLAELSLARCVAAVPEGGEA